MDMSEPSVGSKSPKLQARALKHRELSFKRRNNIKDEDKLAPVADDTNDRTRSCGGLGHGSAAGESGTQHVRKSSENPLDNLKRLCEIKSLSSPNSATSLRSTLRERWGFNGHSKVAALRASTADRSTSLPPLKVCKTPGCHQPSYMVQANGYCTTCNRQKNARTVDSSIDHPDFGVGSGCKLTPRALKRQRERSKRVSRMTFADIQKTELRARRLVQRKEMRGRFMALLTELVLQGRRTVNVKSRWVLLPNSSLRRKWDFIALVMLTYTAIFTPYQISFLGEEMTVRNVAKWPVVFAIDVVVDLFFWVDIVLNFRSAWETPDGRLYFDQSDAARRYVRGWFFLDLVSVLPFHYLALLFDEGGGSLRLPRLLRLFRLAKIFKVLRASRIFKRWEQNISVKYGVIRLWKFLIGIMVVCHWMACGFFLTAKTEDSPDSWLRRFPAQASDAAEDAGAEGEGGGVGVRAVGMAAGNTHFYIDRSAQDTYTASLYWGIMTLTTIGFGDIYPVTTTEKIYVIFAMVIGAAYFTYVVGTMCQLVQGLDIMSLRFQEQMDAMNDYLAVSQVPDVLRTRVRKYCFWRRDTQRKANEESLFNAMSPSLRQEILLHNHEARLRAVPHFANAPKTFIARLAQALRPCTFGPNDVVLEDGQENLKLYCIAKGRVQVENCWTEYVEVTAILHEGSTVGERGLMARSYSSSTYRTLTFCEMYECSTAKAREMIAHWPLVKQRVRQLVVRAIWKSVLQSGFFGSLLKDGRDAILEDIPAADLTTFREDDAADAKAVVPPDLKEQFLALKQSLDERLTRMEQAIERIAASAAHG